MFITKKYLPRRTFLRGLMGTTVALPLLDAMVPALMAQDKTAAKPQLRFMGTYAPHGSIPKQWRPEAEGKDFKFTPAIEPFEPFRDQVVVVSGLGQYNPAKTPHLSASSMWLNATSPQAYESADVREDTTLDQLIAAKIGQDTPLPSLEVAMEDMSQAIGACDSGYSCVYMSTISWRTPTTPLPMEINPYVVFERLFGDSATAAERLRTLEDNRSILDSVTQEASRMKGMLGARDRNRLNEYLENIREVERRIQNTMARNNENVHVPDAPPGVPESYDEHAKLLYDLIHVAFQGDVTRVGTFMLACEGSDINYPAVGIIEGDHTLSHHGNIPEKMKLRIAVNNYHSSLTAYFLDKLRKTPDGDGTLFDHTVTFHGSGMGEGNEHGRTSLPELVAGGKSFGINGGRHIAFKGDTPMANLLLSIAQKCDIPVEKIGNSNGVVDL